MTKAIWNVFRENSRKLAELRQRFGVRWALRGPDYTGVTPMHLNEFIYILILVEVEIDLIVNQTDLI